MKNTESIDERKYLASLKSLGNSFPEDRRTLETHNIRWFLHNAILFSKESPECDYALTLAKKILNSREQ